MPFSTKEVENDFIFDIFWRRQEIKH